MTKKKQEYREWVRLVDFKKVNGMLVKGVRYLAPPSVGRPFLYPGGETPKQLPLGPRPENTATVASPDETAAYEVGGQAGRKRVLETVRDMSSRELQSMRLQRPPRRAEMLPVREHTIIA